MYGYCKLMHEADVIMTLSLIRVNLGRNLILNPSRELGLIQYISFSFHSPVFTFRKKKEEEK
jgi:hypothetical protein